jgi:methyl-accepting chemotaxis protein
MSLGFVANLSLKTKIVASTILICTLGLAIVVTILTNDAAGTLRRNAVALAEEIARTQAQEIRNDMDAAFMTGRALRDLTASLQKTGASSPRESFDGTLEQLLRQNPTWLGVWAAFEPNGFDGRDADFAGIAGYSPEGRFVPYWNRGSGKEMRELAISGTETAEQMAFYTTPQRTGREMVSNPVAWEVGGRSVLLTIIVVPLVRDGRFIGVAGVDLALDMIQRRVGALRPLESGHAGLIAAGGTWVSNPDEATIGKPVSGDFYTRGLAANGRGESFAELRRRSDRRAQLQRSAAGSFRRGTGGLVDRGRSAGLDAPPRHRRHDQAQPAGGIRCYPAGVRDLLAGRTSHRERRERYDPVHDRPGPWRSGDAGAGP